MNMENGIIHLKKNMTWEEKKQAIEASLFMGFQNVSAQFPIAAVEAGRGVSSNLKSVYEQHMNWEEDKLKEGKLKEDKLKVDKLKVGKPKEDKLNIGDTKQNSAADYISATGHAKPIPEFDWRSKKGLETIFREGYFLKDRNYDLLPDLLDFKIALPQESDISVVIAACNFAFRFGMETTAYEGCIVAADGYKGNLLIFEPTVPAESDVTSADCIECGMKLEEREAGKAVVIYGGGKALETFSAYICEHFPVLPDAKTWTDQLQTITDSLAMKNLDGQLAYLKTFQAEQSGSIKAFVSPEIDHRITELSPEFKKVEFQNYKGMKKIYEREYDIPWEVDVFGHILDKEVYPLLKAGDTIQITGALSEESDTRKALKEQIEGTIKEKDVTVEQVQILCAYKQGISWIEEAVLPRLKDISKLKKVQIAFQPFLPEGVTSWGDIDGATPSYNNTKADDPDKWYDLPIRFLQELYPIEDIIAEKLSLDREQIEFVKYAGKEAVTYVFKAFTEDSNSEEDCEVLSMNYKVAYSERPYLDEYPQLGKVHPNTGYINVSINGKNVLSNRIATDVESIWNIYQQQVLPECKAFVETKTIGKISANMQPFFSQLKLEITASEPDYRLKSREDLISTLDALHEDIYFVGADYFKNLGIQKAGEILDAPGLILPVIKKGTGKPLFRVTLFDQCSKQPCLIGGADEVTSLAGREEIEVYLEKLTSKDKHVTAHVHVTLPNESIVKNYVALMNQGLLDICGQFTGVDAIEFRINNHSYSAKLVAAKEQEKTLDIRDIDLLEHTVIGYEQYLEIIGQLKKVPGIAVYKTTTSYAGRDVYAIEVLPKEAGYISMTKRITRLPSEIINSRHHANEVSSTNAAFILLKALLTQEAYRDLPNKLNLVIVPMENVDGTAIHYELQKDNPNWKFHVARFNAIGKEFYHEHFKSDTIHTEAQSLTWLWKRFLPDVIVDNHGVPSHEWEQQFSGYTSPSFKGFWLPRSLLYGYFWMVSDEEYKSNYAVNKKMEDVIADAIGSNSEMKALNKEWMGRFEKYAHSWMPKLFPANYYKDMINYWIPFAHDETHRYPSIRFPWITTVAYTSEVADETAQGDYLNLCARAHVTHDLAIIDLLMNCQCIFESKCNIMDSQVSISQIRQRPIVV